MAEKGLPLLADGSQYQWPAGFDWRSYRGCWVALIGDQVAGVGQTLQAASLAARHSRPREEITLLCFVPRDPSSG